MTLLYFQFSKSQLPILIFYVNGEPAALHQKYRAFSLAWPAAMQIYMNKRMRLQKKRVQPSQEWFVHRRGRRFCVLELQYGCHDVM